MASGWSPTLPPDVGMHVHREQPPAFDQLAIVAGLVDLDDQEGQASPKMWWASMMPDDSSSCVMKAAPARRTASVVRHLEAERV